MCGATRLLLVPGRLPGSALGRRHYAMGRMEVFVGSLIHTSTAIRDIMRIMAGARKCEMECSFRTHRRGFAHIGEDGTGE